MREDEEIDADDSIDHGAEVLEINIGKALELKLHARRDINLIELALSRQNAIAHIQPVYI